MLFIRRRAGFTIIELAIVITAISLIVGGIISGQAMVHNAKLRSVLTDANMYRDAIRNFRDQYHAIPGDMINARVYWPTAAAFGNGNGIVEYVMANGASGAGTTEEAFLFWNHLALSGLIAGSYSGKAGPTSAFDYGQFKTNSPKSAFVNVGWQATYFDNSDGHDANLFKRSYLNWLGIGLDSGSAGTYADDAFMRADEAYAIDKKSDDGVPWQGNIQSGWNISSCTTATSNADFTATYKLTSNLDMACSLQFKY